MDYGRNLKLARKWAKMTQKELADKAKVATITIQQYESGKRKPSMEIWFSIANALNLSIDELNNADELPTKPLNPETALEGIEEEWQKNRTGKTESYQPYTKVDDELLKLGGFGVLAEFYNLAADDQKEAMKDIKSFVEYTIAKYKKQADDSTEDKK